MGLPAACGRGGQEPGSQRSRWQREAVLWAALAGVKGRLWSQGSWFQPQLRPHPGDPVKCLGSRILILLGRNRGSEGTSLTGLSLGLSTESRPGSERAEGTGAIFAAQIKAAVAASSRKPS